jgi:hypothetical protein
VAAPLGAEKGNPPYLNYQSRSAMDASRMSRQKLTTTEKLLFAIPVAILALPFLLRATRPLDFVARFDPRGDALEKAMRRRAGYGSDCGVVSTNQWTASKASEANACAMAAINAKQPFHLVYGGYEMDSYRARALAGTAAGKVYSYEYDSNPGQENKGEFVKEYACPNPQLIKGGQQMIVCE